MSLRSSNQEVGVGHTRLWEFQGERPEVLGEKGDAPVLGPERGEGGRRSLGRRARPVSSLQARGRSPGCASSSSRAHAGALETGLHMIPSRTEGVARAEELGRGVLRGSPFWGRVEGWEASGGRGGVEGETQVREESQDRVAQSRVVGGACVCRVGRRLF